MFSDLYVGLKILARVQAERRAEAVKNIARLASSNADEAEAEKIIRNESEEQHPSKLVFFNR